MGKVLVPARLEEEFRADASLAGRPAETVGDFAEAMKRLASGSADAVFVGSGCPPLDKAAFDAITGTLQAIANPVLLMCADSSCLWANDSAREEGLGAAAESGAAVTEMFDETWRNPWRRALARATQERRLVRTIVSMKGAQYETSVTPVGAPGSGLAAAVFGRRNLASSLAGRLEKLAGAAPNLFPQDAEKMVRLPHEERIAFIKDLIEKAVREVFEFDDFIVRTLDHATGTLEAIIARSGSGATFSKRVLNAGTQGNSVAGYVAATGKPYIVEDTREEPLWISDLVEVRSAVVVPLKIGEKVMGTFAVEKKEPGAYDRYDMILAGIFAGYITALLDITDLIRMGQKVLVDRMAETVVEEATQPLTGILDSIEELRRLNIGDSIAVISRIESIKGSVSAIREAIQKGAARVGATVTPAAAPADETLSGRSILIADDEPSILQSLGDILKGAGSRVEFAHDGLEAVEMATKAHYDLVISDIKMPKMSGYEVYASIKSRFPDTSVILMTAYGYDPTHSIVRARQEGLEAVLYKPFRAETLKKALKQALQKKA